MSVGHDDRQMILLFSLLSCRVNRPNSKFGIQLSTYPDWHTLQTYSEEWSELWTNKSMKGSESQQLHRRRTRNIFVSLEWFVLERKIYYVLYSTVSSPIINVTNIKIMYVAFTTAFKRVLCTFSPAKAKRPVKFYNSCFGFILLLIFKLLFFTRRRLLGTAGKMFSSVL